MSSIYSPVFSFKTGWVVGKIENHMARPLTHDEVEFVCKILAPTQEAPKGHGMGPVSPSIPTEAEPVFFFEDGNQWCAVRRDFVNLQESLGGFGSSQSFALIHLEQQEAEE